MRYRHLRRTLAPNRVIIRLPWGPRIAVNPNEYIGNEIFYEQFSLAQVRLIRALLQRGMTFVDVGGNIGYFTIIAAERVGACGRVYSFEPITTDELRGNVARNHFEQVTIIDSAIAATVDEVTLHVGDSRNRGTSSISQPVNFSGVTRSCKTTTLDTIFTTGSVDLMKMDIEGAEPLALRGAAKTLSSKPILIFEVSPICLGRAGFTVEDIQIPLAKMGYWFYRINNHGPLITRLRPSEWSEEMDVLAISPRHLLAQQKRFLEAHGLDCLTGSTSHE